MTATISTGEPSTLRTYRKIAALLTGEDSPATKLIDDKIKEEGEDAEVIQHESQMLFMIVKLGLGTEIEQIAEEAAIESAENAGDSDTANDTEPDH